MIQYDILFHPIFLYENDLICIYITINELFKRLLLMNSLKEMRANHGKTIDYHGGCGNETSFLAHLRRYIMGAKLFSGTTYMRNNITVNASGM